MKKRWMIPIIALLFVCVLAGFWFGLNQGFQWAENVRAEGVIFGDTIAVVNADTGVLVDGAMVNYSAAIIQTLGEGFHLVSPAMAQNGLAAGVYSAILTFPSNVSERIVAFNAGHTQRVELEFIVNPLLSETQYIETHIQLLDLQMAINLTLAHTYISSILTQFHAGQDEVAMVFGNNDTKVSALEFLELQAFTASLMMDFLPDLPFNPNEPDTSHHLIAITDFARDISAMYLDSYSNARESFFSMRAGLFGLVEDFESQSEAWLLDLENWSEDLREFSYSLTEFTGALDNHRDDLVAWRLDALLWHEHLMEHSGDIEAWYIELSDSFNDLGAWYGYLDAWRVGLNSWRAGVGASSVVGLLEHILSEPNPNDFICLNQHGVLNANCDPGNPCNPTVPCGPGFCIHVCGPFCCPCPSGHPTNCSCATCPCSPFCGQDFTVAWNNWYNNLMGLIWAVQGNADLQNILQSGNLGIPNFAGTNVDAPPASFGGQDAPDPDDLEELSEFPYDLPIDPTGGSDPPRPDDFWDYDLHAAILLFDIYAFLTDDIRAAIDTRLEHYADYLGTVRLDLESQFAVNVAMLMDLRSGYVQYLADLRTAAMDAESEEMENLRERIEAFREIAELSSEDTQERLINFSGMIPLSRTYAGVNREMVDFVVAPIDLVRPVIRAEMVVDDTTMAGIIPWWLWLVIAIFIISLIGVIIYSIIEAMRRDGRRDAKVQE